MRDSRNPEIFPASEGNLGRGGKGLPSSGKEREDLRGLRGCTGGKLNNPRLSKRASPILAVAVHGRPFALSQLVTLQNRSTSSAREEDLFCSTNRVNRLSK